MEDLPDALDRLASRLEVLEQRVLALEHPATFAEEVAAPEPSQPHATVQDAEHSTPVTSGAFPVLGKAMLGIAGAYLLRAVAESSVLPRAAVAAVAIAYALAWLAWASRARAGGWLAGTTYACTSALILAPMLWELTLRFNVLAAPASAGVISGFVIAASALAWKRDFEPVVWVANMTAAAIALALAIASHQMLPFVVVLLLMVLICEYGTVLNREAGARVLVALAADVAVWGLIYIYESQASARTDYPPLSAIALIAPGVALFLILGASVIYRTVVKRGKISVFDTIEMMIAFLLAVCSLIYFGPPSSATALGIFCVALSLAGYAAALIHFDFAAERRNYRVFASWSAALFMAGSLMCIPKLWQAPWLGAAAVAATIASTWLRRMALELHGIVFLLAAAWISGLLDMIFNTLAGTLPGVPGWGACIVSACAGLCYFVIKPCADKSCTRQALSIVFAALAIGAAAALLVQGLVGLTALKVIPGAHHLAFIRTLTACGAAVALAFSGAHWRRMELTRIGYATLALLAVKLLLEDLRHGHLAFIAGSIFLFAITLIVVPRVGRMGQRM